MRGVVILAALALALVGCGGGGAAPSGKPGDAAGASGVDGGNLGGGAVGGGIDGGGNNGGDIDGGSDDGGQVLPPYRGRIVLSPAALLFTAAGQTAMLRAQAFDATGAPMDVTFTFASSRPDQVAVDDAGNVTAMTALGSTQITVTGAGLASQPLVVLVVQPQPGTVLVADAQVIAGPTQVDPTADPLPGAQFLVTLDGVGNLAPGTMLISREGNPVAGQVVSTAPNGAYTDVVYQLPTLANMFARLDFQGGWDYNLQTAADDAAIAAKAAAAKADPSSRTGRVFSGLTSDEFLLGPFTCKATLDPTGVKIEGSVSLNPDLHFDAAFSQDDNGNWVQARMVASGSLKSSGKVVVRLSPGAIAALSCKVELGDFVIPLAGVLSKIVAPRVSVGIKAEVKAQATATEMALGGKLQETAHFQLGFDDSVNTGVGDIATLTLDDPHLEPMYSLNADVAVIGAELSAALGAYAALNLTAAKFTLAEAFLGAKLKYQMTTLVNQVGGAANNYQLKAPVKEIGPGSSIKKALALFGIAIDFKATFNDEGSVIATSPAGTFSADNKGLNVPVNSPVTFTVKLDPLTTAFLGIPNISGVHFYRVDQPKVVEPLNEVKYVGGAGPTFSYTWTPDFTNTGPHLFFAAFDDLLVSSQDKIGVTAPFYVGTSPPIQINVGPTTGNWSGTATLSWHGSGTDPISGGVDTIDGTQTITWIPGTSSLDGISFQMVATSVVFTYNETHTSGYTQGACSAHEVWQESGTVTLTGADADKQAHGFMTVVPLAAGSSLADYTSGIPGASIELPFTDDTTSDCTAPSHLQGLTGASATPSSMTGTIQANATTISDGTTYTVDGGGFPVTYTASWNLQKM